MIISIINKQKTHEVALSRLRRSMTKMLKALGCQDCEVNVLLVDDEQIREMNREYLQRDRPTNVISFAMTEGSYGELHPEILGDIIISVTTAARDAQAARLDFMDEVEFLLIHGLLHLLGYNHEGSSADEEERMKNKEKELFRLLRHYDID
jgi:probable rRNA maturation factor